MSGIDVLAVIDVEIADRRREGDTGNVENLIEARAAVAELIESAETLERIDRGLWAESGRDDAVKAIYAALARVQGVSE